MSHGNTTSIFQQHFSLGLQRLITNQLQSIIQFLNFQ